MALVEVGTSAGASAFSGNNASGQTSPGTASDAVSSGLVTVSGAVTLLSLGTDSASLTASDTPNAGTGFTSRGNNVSNAIGAWRLESKAATANAAGTFTAPTGSHNFCTYAIAIKNSAAAIANEPVTRPTLRGALKPGRGPLNTGKFRVSNAPAISTPLGANVTLALTGASATFSAGSLTPAISLALTGAAATFSAGSLSANASLALSGAQATFSAGSLGASIQSPSVEWGARPRPGRGPFSTGKFFVGSDIVYTASSANVTVALTGVTATFSAGLLTPSTALALTGASAAFTAGTLSPSLSVAMSGTAANFAAGNLGVATSKGLTGQVATFSAGSLSASASGNVSVALTGASATFVAGSLTASGGTAPVGRFFYTVQLKNVVVTVLL